MKKKAYDSKSFLGIFGWGLFCFVIASCKVSSDLSSNAYCPFGICSENSLEKNQSPFKVTLKSYWEDDEENELPTTHELELMDPDKKDLTGQETATTGLACEIPAGQLPVGSSDYANPNTYFKAMRTCGVKIPETQLWMSKLEFTVETSENHQCDVIRTFPNYYLASRSKEFSPPWDPGQKIDCEDTGNFGYPQNKECYNGTAKQLIDGFPINTHISESISNKTPRYLRKWLIDSARKALNGNYGAGNTWTSFQPDRFLKYPTWGLDLPSSKFLWDSEGAATFFIGNSHTWHFQCIKTGSNLNYQYEIRIIPTPDGNLNPGAYRPRSWGYWNAEQPTAINSANILQGPVDGEFEITLLSPAGTGSSAPPAQPYNDISRSDAIYICKKKDTDPESYECNETFPPKEPRYFCEIDPGDTGENYICKMPPLNFVTEAGSYLFWHAKSNTLMTKANFEFEYKKLSISEVSTTIGPAVGGTILTIKGAGFAKDVKVTIGDKNCPVVPESLNETFTEVQCTAPGETLAAGIATLDKAIKISNPTSEQEKTHETSFTYFRPVVTSVTTAGTCTEGFPCTVTINGTFNPDGNNYTVTVGDESCSSVENNTDGTQLTCSFTPPADSAGELGVVVEDRYEQSVTADEQITVTAPATP